MSTNLEFCKVTLITTNDQQEIQIPFGRLTSDVTAAIEPIAEALQEIQIESFEHFDHFNFRDLLVKTGMLTNPIRWRFNSSPEAYADPLEAILAVVQRGLPPRSAKALQDAAAAAIDGRHSSRIDVAAEYAASRFKDMGYRTVSKSKLKKQATEWLGEDDSGSKTTLKLGTDLLKEWLRMAYFRGDIFAFERYSWRPLSQDELKGISSRFLIGAGVNARFDSKRTDLTAFLQGATLVPDWDLGMPRWLPAPTAEMDGTPMTSTDTTIDPKMLLPLRNGLLDLRPLHSGEAPILRPINPELFTTFAMPVGYDPAATCPWWDVTLAELLLPIPGTDFRIARLQEMFGYTLLFGDHRFQKLAILVGSGANGKSTVLAALQALLGTNNTSSVPLDAFATEFRLIEILNKAANIAADLPRMNSVEIGRLKELVTGDSISFNGKHKSPFTARPTAKLWFACNQLPPFYDPSDGLWRRLITIPFMRRVGVDFPVDRNRVERLLDELPGILNWALVGLARLIRQGGFTACSVCDQVLAEHRRLSDAILEFVEARCIVGPTQTVFCCDLYDRYKFWALDNGRKPKSAAELGRHLSEMHGITRSREGTGPRRYFYQGIALQPDVGTQLSG